MLETYGDEADNRMAVKGPGLLPATAKLNTLVASLAPNNWPDATERGSSAVGMHGEVESMGELLRGGSSRAGRVNL